MAFVRLAATTVAVAMIAGAAEAAEGSAPSLQAGTPESQPVKGLPASALTCWQNGVSVVQLDEIVSVSEWSGRVSMRLADGTNLELLGAESVPALCLLRKARSQGDARN